MDLILLTTVHNSIDAKLISNNLRNYGIESYLINENFSNLMPHFFGLMGAGIQIKVKEEDLQKAREIIDINEATIRCPNCKSEDLTINIEKKKNKIGLILLMLLVAPAGNLMNSYTCNNCGFKFRK